MKLEEQGYAIFDCSESFALSCEVSLFTCNVIQPKPLRSIPTTSKVRISTGFWMMANPTDLRGARSLLSERPLPTVDLQTTRSSEGLP